MTVEPAPTRVNRINSDSLDGSYIEVSIAVGYAKGAACEGAYAGPDASICEARASRSCLSPRPIAWVVLSVSLSCSSVELDQILEDQPTPTISARLHEQSAFRKPAKFDRRETKTFCELTDLRCSVFIVARKEHDSPATPYRRILVKDRGDQMVEAL